MDSFVCEFLDTMGNTMVRPIVGFFNESYGDTPNGVQGVIVQLDDYWTHAVRVERIIRMYRPEPTTSIDDI